jgi:hypothetical protein
MPPPGFPRSARADALALAALAALLLFFFHPLLFGGESLYYDDLARYQLPLWTQVRDAWADLRLPLWNPYVWMGTPLAANPAAGAFYPPTWALLPLDPVTGLNAAVVLHLYLGGLFTYVLARERAGSGAAPFAAAAGYSLGGVALTYATNPFYLFSLTWLPLALFAFRRALAGRTLLYGALTGLALALMVLGGDVQLPLIAAIVLGVVALARVGLAPPGTRRATLARAAGALAIAGVVGLGLGAVQLLPTLELASLSERAAGLPAAVRQHFSFHPARAATLLSPYFFGVPLPENSYWGMHLGDGPRFWFLSVYAGALLLAFALAALRRDDPWPLSLSAALVLCFALALGRHGPFYEPAAQAVPGLDQFRYPEKFLAPLAVLVPVLGAEGLARLAREEARGRTLVALLALAVLGGAAWALSGVAEGALATRLPVPFLSRAAADRIAGDGRNLLGLALPAALLVAGSRRGWVKPARLLPLLASLATLDLAAAARRLVWTEPAQDLRAPPALVASLPPAGPAPPRFLRLPALDRVPLHRDEAGWRRAWDHLRRGLVPNLHALHRVSGLAGYGAGAPGEVQVVFSGFDDREASRLAAALAAPSLLAAGATRGGLPTTTLHPLGDALPRARLAGALVADDTIVRARALVLGGHDFARAAIVESGHALLGGDVLPRDEARRRAAALPPAGAGSARIASFRPEEVVIDVTAQTPSLLVLSEAFFPGWRAWVDGVEVPIHRADFLGRGVAISDGERRVVFRFEAPSVALGAQVTLAMAAILGLLALAARVRRRIAPRL